MPPSRSRRSIRRRHRRLAGRGTLHPVRRPGDPGSRVERRSMPRGKRGATNLMTALLEEGAGNRDAREFAAAAEVLAARFDFDVWDDALSISAEMLTESRGEAVALLCRTFCRGPRFDEDAHRKGARLGPSQTSRLRRPDPATSPALRSPRPPTEIIPMQADISGTAESVSSLTRDDLVEAKERVIARDRLYVLGRRRHHGRGARRTAGHALRRPAGREVRRRPAQRKVELAGGTTVVPFETPQSVARFGQEGISSR